MLIPERDRDTAGMALEGCADVKADGAIARAEVGSMPEGAGIGVGNGAGPRLTSRSGGDGAIVTVGSEVTGGGVEDGAVKGVWGEGVTGFSSDARATDGPAVAGGPAAILDGFRLALGSTTSWGTMQTTSTIADSAAPVRKAATSRVIQTPTQAPRQ